MKESITPEHQNISRLRVVLVHWGKTCTISIQEKDAQSWPYRENMRYARSTQVARRRARDILCITSALTQRKPANLGTVKSEECPTVRLHMAHYDRYKIV